jgi:hypothetical protein
MSGIAVFAVRSNGVFGTPRASIRVALACEMIADILHRQ